jgi:hypothetical protein
LKLGDSEQRHPSWGSQVQPLQVRHRCEGFGDGFSELVTVEAEYFESVKPVVPDAAKGTPDAGRAVCPVTTPPRWFLGPSEGTDLRTGSASGPELRDIALVAQVQRCFSPPAATKTPGHRGWSNLSQLKRGYQRIHAISDEAARGGVGS